MAYYPAFNAPSANEAYEHAPDLATEAAMADEFAEFHETQMDDQDRAEIEQDQDVRDMYRECLLRIAAVADRRWWQSRSEADLTAAARAAGALQNFDQAHPEQSAGPFGPDSVEWDATGGGRAYVRQEYLAWLIPQITERNSAD
ncbi:hypothetical protein [Kitasatospora sp. NPDC086791]|uniref:hypothetical protein n=1 Tax=Kitasatospora sp. NPDC086791 TaxID=3155178 RepID=UPI003436873B